MAIADISDRWLWVGFGIFFLLAARGIRHATADTPRLMESPPNEERARKNGKEQREDQISLTSLRVLMSSPNPNIRCAVASLIARRFASLHNAAEIIDRDLRCEDPDIQRQARQAIEFIQDHGLPSFFTYGLGPDGNHWSYSIDYEANPDFAQWPQRSSEHELYSSAREDVLSPLSQLETLTSIDALNGIGAEREESGSARFAGWDRIPVERPVTVEQGEAERRRGRREVVVIHEGPGGINESDIYRPR